MTWIQQENNTVMLIIYLMVVRICCDIGDVPNLKKKYVTWCNVTSIQAVLAYLELRLNLFLDV